MQPLHRKLVTLVSSYIFKVMSNTSNSFTTLCSPPPPSSVTPMLAMLDTAAEQLMVHRDFQAAFDTCDRALKSLYYVEQEYNRCVELKTGFCILGIQALAEMNHWHGVLSWVLQQYEHYEKIPAKILQMCILLYFKVEEPAVIQEAARVWLHCPSNSRIAGFGTVAELYLLHVLLPLGHIEEARQMIRGEIGSCVFTEEQRQMALDVIEEKEHHSHKLPLNPTSSQSSEIPADLAPPPGAVIHKLEAMFRFLYRKLMVSGPGSFPLHKVCLVAVLLYMLLIRIDPALPSSFMWISKLHQLLKQLWRVMFAPYSQALGHNKGV